MRPLVTALAAIALMCVGCGGGANLERDVTGKTWAYVPGLPDFDFEAVVRATGTNSIADIYLSIPPSSLTFTLAGKRYLSLLEISARVRVPGSDDIVFDKAWAETTWAASYESTQRGSPVQIREEMPLPQGTHIIEVALEDRNTGKRSFRRQEVTAFDLESGRPAIGRIRLDQPGEGADYSLVISEFLRAGLDSVRSSVEILNIPTDVTSYLTFVLTEHHPDTLIANAPYKFSPVLYQRSYRELTETRADTVARMLTLISGNRRTTTAVFYLPPLTKGIYRLSCEVKIPGGSTQSEDTVLSTSRLFSVEPAAYPRPSTLEELVDAFRYIATDTEIALLHDASSPQRRKELFDSLWLSFTHDEERSAALIRRYYTRVEEANKQFTTMKEGWKTDRGMVYIVLGPPVEIATSGIDILQWHYELPRTNTVTTFTFRRVIVDAEGVAFKEYVLLRSGGFEIPWDYMVSKWREGTVF